MTSDEVEEVDEGEMIIATTVGGTTQLVDLADYLSCHGALADKFRAGMKPAGFAL